ncbi:PREDICTED: uncharacterized protein C12orf73 homolog isoform X1 [Colobus angolensis palliatus]|uniref:uncharacterized protein C12orf73 homolog isoform X1 n=1 Tax=Colobus angolensis palliatus TaxID=336983 RepID=UPI0005F45202|nr:PREDICTED: uncharacterized protein C12orf73 homolog isoform X1 [Colobus angolensis palliatus]
MPAGVPMSTYLKMFTASLLAMFAGAEVVHRYYRPDLVTGSQVFQSENWKVWAESNRGDHDDCPDLCFSAVLGRTATDNT